MASSKRGCVPAYLAKEHSDGAVRLLVHSESQRAFCPRDDKMGKEWNVGFDNHTHSCHCEEEAGADDAAIHRVSEDADDLSVRFLVHSGSPRAFALAMTR